MRDTLPAAYRRRRKGQPLVGNPVNTVTATERVQVVGDRPLKDYTLSRVRLVDLVGTGHEDGGS